MGKLKRRLNREIIVIVGKTGTGKTYFANSLLYNYDRVVIIDPINEYDGLLFTNYDDLHDHIDNNPFYRARIIDLDEDTLENVSQIVYDAGDTYICIEEAQRLIPWGRSELPESFEDIIYRGRHMQISLVIVAQRASTINIAIRSQYTKIYAFAQTEKADLDWLYKTTGYAEVYELQKFTGHEYFEITPSGIEKRGMVTKTGHN